MFTTFFNIIILLTFSIVFVFLYFDFVDNKIKKYEEKENDNKRFENFSKRTNIKKEP